MQSVEFRQIASTAQRKFRIRIRWVLAVIFISSLEAVFLGHVEA